jgi:hypothetical protein
MTTGVAALATWVVTAGFGSSLFITWLARGGVTQHPPRRRLTVRLPPPYFPALLVFSHLLLAAGGQVIWVSYLMTDSAVLAWIALFVLLPVAVFGFRHVRPLAGQPAPSGCSGLPRQGAG